MAYEYVKQHYGVDPVIGGRVRLENTQREGVIARRRTYDHHVWVTFDGQGFASPCHPKSLEYLPAEPATPVGDPPIGTSLSELSGRPGHPGYERFRAIAASWGYD